MRSALWNGIRALCPACGKEKIYRSWNHLQEHCPACGTPLRKHEDDTWFFMYISTAAITGIFIVAMFLFQPTDALLGRVVLAVLAFACIVGTLPYRKGLALALHWLFQRRLP